MAEFVVIAEIPDLPEAGWNSVAYMLALDLSYPNPQPQPFGRVLDARREGAMHLLIEAENTAFASIVAVQRLGAVLCSEQLGDYFVRVASVRRRALLDDKGP